MTLLSKRLYALMLEKNVAQKDLSAITHIERSTLTKILNGTTISPKVETLKTLAKYFEVDIAYLLDDKDDERTIYDGNPISLNLKELIKSHSLTSLALHNHTGISESVISDILSGNTQNPNIKTLQSLSKFFNISISQLMGKAPFHSNESNLNYSMITIPFIMYENLEKWINSNFSDADKYIKINRNVLGNKAFAIKFNENNLSPDIQSGEVIVIDPSIGLQVNDIFIGKYTKIVVCEVLKMLDNEFILRELVTNNIIKVNQNNIINYGAIVQKYFDK